MTKNTLKAATLAIAAFGLISTAAAQPPGGPMRQRGGPEGGPGGGFGRGPAPIEMIAERLNLTDDQQAQWKAIHERARESGEPLMKAAGAAHQAFDKALENGNPDAAAVGQAAIAMRAAERKLEAHRKATLEEVKSILTPEQASKFEEMEKHSGRPGPGGFGRGPGGPEGQGPKRRPVPDSR